MHPTLIVVIESHGQYETVRHFTVKPEAVYDCLLDDLEDWNGGLFEPKDRAYHFLYGYGASERLEIADPTCKYEGVVVVSVIFASGS